MAVADGIVMRNGGGGVEAFGVRDLGVVVVVERMGVVAAGGAAACKRRLRR